MTERRMPSGGLGISDALQALRLTVFLFFVLDVVTIQIAHLFGVSDSGPTGAIPALQMCLLVAAAAATLWNHSRTAVAFTAVAVALVLLVGPCGEEVWLVVITAVTAAAKARRVLLALAVGGQLAYAVGFGLDTERRHRGWGWHAGLTVLGFAAAAFAAGLVARWLLRTRDRRRARVWELDRDRQQIRSLERARLAGELQAIVTQGLATIDVELDAVGRRWHDLSSLRHGLDQVELSSRSLLSQLRALLDILRREPEPSVSLPAKGPRRWLDLMTARHVRMAGTALFGLLAVRALVDGDPRSGVEIWGQALGLLACAVAIWRPAPASVIAGTSIVLSAVFETPGYWDALPVALLCLMGALRSSTRTFWLGVVALSSYGGLLAVITSVHRSEHIFLVWIVGLLGVAVGLAARHFSEARDDSVRQLGELVSERGRVETEERSAVARELHDVVAHQLSLTTMLIMATSMSSNPATLAETLGKVRHSTASARLELGTLLQAMRRPGDDTPATSSAAPLASSRELAERLVENGYHPVMAVDPAVDDLDSTTQRTLNRIMQEASTNILRYAPPDAACDYTLTVQAADVRLRISSPLSDGSPQSSLSLGWGLRGIRERVDLTHGTFSAGPEGDRWVLSVTLPASTGVTKPLVDRSA